MQQVGFGVVVKENKRELFVRTYATEATFLAHPCAQWDQRAPNEPWDPRELLRAFRQDVASFENDMVQIGPTEEKVLNHGMAQTWGAWPGSPGPPQLSPHSPASKSKRQDFPTPRRLSYDPEAAAGPSGPAEPSGPSEQPPDAPPVEESSGEQAQFDEFMLRMKPVFSTRVIYRGNIMASANIEVNDTLDPDTIVRAVLQARDMLQIRNKAYLKFAIQASLVLRTVDENGSVSYHPFLASSNTSLFGGQTRALFPDSSLTDLYEYFSSTPLRVRVMMMAPRESKDALCSVSCDKVLQR